MWTLCTQLSLDVCESLPEPQMGVTVHSGRQGAPGSILYLMCFSTHASWYSPAPLCMASIRRKKSRKKQTVPGGLQWVCVCTCCPATYHPSRASSKTPKIVEAQTSNVHSYLGTGGASTWAGTAVFLDLALGHAEDSAARDTRRDRKSSTNSIGRCNLSIAPIAATALFGVNDPAVTPTSFTNPLGNFGIWDNAATLGAEKHSRDGNQCLWTNPPPPAAIDRRLCCRRRRTQRPPTATREGGGATGGRR